MKLLNHIFRTIWSEALGVWIAVSEITKSKGKRSISGCIRTGHINGVQGVDFILRLKPILIALACCFAINAQANPTGGVVVNGQASFNTSGNTLTVTNTPGTIINWQGFSIGANQVTHFAQQSAASAVLNRVVTNNPSVILGTLSSNGRVYLVNPGGVVFGVGSTVDVAGLVATSLNLSDADFLAGRHNFTAVAGAQNISNAGNITAQQGGEIFLIAPNVENTGIITAPNGEILLAAGHEVQLVNSLDPNLRVSITAPAGDATNLGQLVVQSGSLGLFGAVVRNTGTVSADSATLQGGKIVFKASQRVEAGGTVSANGTSGGSVTIAVDHSADANAPGVVIHTGSIRAQGAAGTGGAVTLSGDSILSSASIDTDGTLAGGQISVQADNTVISTAAAQYTANSAQGQGGDILVSANVSNYTSGSYSATGATGGNLTLAGNEIKLAGTQLDASGTNGGGNVHIGGLMHGAEGFGAQGIALANSTMVLTNSATRIRANALQSGNGGEVVLWSDQSMNFNGNVSATGGASGGNGGNAEISGLTALGYNGLTNLSAANGLNGTLLLDPRNITIVPGNGNGMSGSTYMEILDPTPGAAEGFGGWQNTELNNGNILISSPYDSTFGTHSGAVYLYNPSGTLISAVVGSAANDRVGAYTIYDYSGVTVLGNGNVIITSDNWSGGMGAVTWMSSSGLLSTGSTGGTVSSLNSLVGSSAGDKVGSTGNLNGLTQLANGNVVISSSYWNNGGTPANGLGAVTWMNGTNGKLSDGTNGGVVSATNSLVGSTAGDLVGFGGITQVNGNYVVRSHLWGSSGVAANALGAMTWMNGSNGHLTTTATGGVLSSANSLVGSTAGDKVGTMSITQVNSGIPYTYDQSGISVGGSGNLVIVSNNWNNGGTVAGAGAVTWMNGTTGALVGGGTGGTISNTNSLVGTGVGDKVGTVNTHPYVWLTQEVSGVMWLPNGNYLVRSGEWGSGGVTDAGRCAVTWGSGTAGVAGNISSANSIVGSSNFDLVGAGWTDSTTADPGVVILSNSNYVVISSQWASGTGAVTWGNGAVGSAGVVSASNSLVGSVSGSFVGSQGITVQTGGSNFVVKSPLFDFNTNTNTGAVTWMNGATGALSNSTFGGVVNGTNSLMGTFVSDGVGAVTALSNGNFVATTPVWNGGIGAVTWMSGSNGHLSDGLFGGSVDGSISGNSLVGSTIGDMTGSSITELTFAGNLGNFLVRNLNWDNGVNANAGAVTWMNGATGALSNGLTGGTIGTANSLVGSSAGDQVGAFFVRELLGNGNVLIFSPNWSNGAATNAGAVTWMNGATGALSNGATGGFVDGNITGNSLVGSTINDSVGGDYGTELWNGNAVFRTSYWINGAATNAGAVTWMNGATGALADGNTGGVITAANSVIGTLVDDYVGYGGVFELTDHSTFDNYAIVSSSWNGVRGAVTWVNGATGKTSDNSGVISAANSLVGSTAFDNLGYSNKLVLGNGNLVIVSNSWNGGMGAVTWMKGSNGRLADNSAGGAVSSGNSMVGTITDIAAGGFGDHIGYDGLVEITDGSTFWNYVILSSSWTNGGASLHAGAVTLGNGVTGTVGVVSASNSLVGGVTNDAVGSAGITLVSNGTTFWNYVVKSPNWGTGVSQTGGMGAVTWVNGQTGQLTTGTVGGVVGSGNSLVGSTSGDQVGVAGGFSGGVNELGNGNLLIRSQHWSGDLSAITWMSGATGKLVGGANGGVVSASNSLLGSTIYDDLGGGGFSELQVNGNWLITSSGWSASRGAVTWMNGTNGRLADGTFGGVVSATNSLVGSGAGDLVGGDILCDCGTPGGINTLSNGNYVVFSPFWNANTGAATWGNGTTGLVGVVSASNSVLGVRNYTGEMATQPGVVMVGVQTANAGAGGVFLLGSSSSGVSGYQFADSPGVDAFIGSGWISSTLNVGTNVVLQANNDITQQAGASISATGAGNLTLQAGRSVVFGDTVNIAGALNVTANDAGANLANRSSGNGVIDSTAATITASLINFTNHGNISNPDGDILVRSLTANSGAINLSASNNIQLSAAGTLRTTAANINLIADSDASGVGGVTLAAGSTIRSNSGNITIAAETFSNASGGNPFTTAGRWLIYTADPTLNTLGGITPTFKRYNCTYAGGCLTAGTTIPATGNGLLYAVAPMLTINAGAQSRLYGQSDALLTYLISAGLIDGDTAATAGLLAGILGHTGTENVLDPHAITQGTLVSPMGYGISFTGGGALSITPAALSVAGNAVNKVLGTPDPLLGYMVSGLQFSDTAGSILTGALARDPGEGIGSYMVNQGTLTLASSNYSMTYAPGSMTILAPTVVQEITEISLRNSPKDKTATTDAEEEKKRALQLLNEAETTTDVGGISEPLPVCR